MFPVDGTNLGRRVQCRKRAYRHCATHLVYALQAGAKATMHAKDAAVDDGAEGEIVEDLAAPAPDIAAAVLALTLVIEAVDLGDLARLVVAADKGHALRVADLERKEEEEGLDAVEATVYKVSLCAASAARISKGEGRDSDGGRRRAKENAPMKR